MGYEKMKVQRRIGCSWTHELVKSIAAGGLTAAQTEPLVYGTYLEVWWRCLKFSKEFTQSCRTGIFPSEGVYKTFCLFGSIEGMSFKDWWTVKGHEFFSESITTLQVSHYVRRNRVNAFEITVDVHQEGASHLAAKEFAFWFDQIRLLNAKNGLLSEVPLAWPIYRSRISYDVISQLLNILEIHDQITRNAPQTKLWQIGEQLRLNPHAMPKPSDYPTAIADKHKAMGQTVSSYLKKGRNLVNNACGGVFPQFS